MRRTNDPVPKEVLNPHTAAEQYTLQTHPPSPDLAPFIDYYWIMLWNLAGQKPFIAEIIPSPYTNLTFSAAGAQITGVTTGKYMYKLKETGSIIGVKFKPGGLHIFWPQSVHQITDKVVPASQLFPTIDDNYNQDILNLSDKHAVHKIETWLRTAQPRSNKNLELISSIMRRIKHAHQLSLNDIIEFAGLSERRLQEIFRAHVGVGIKWIILRARLIRAAQIASKDIRPNWTTLAHDLGYSDQSHFINEFKRIIGKTPLQYTASVRKLSAKTKQAT